MQLHATASETVMDDVFIVHSVTGNVIPRLLTEIQEKKKVEKW